MPSNDFSRDQADDTTPETNGPDAHVCNAGSEPPFALDEDCPDCRAPSGVNCDWSCSSNWKLAPQPRQRGPVSLAAAVAHSLPARVYG